MLAKEAELWMAFGVGNKNRYIPAHKIASKMGDERSRALRMFHAFTGCDTVSSFAGISLGKKKAFQVWTAAPEITPVFARYMCRIRSGSRPDADGRLPREKLWWCIIGSC